MGRNIILCSDGTGNKGGTGSDTNVFKLYHAIKLGRETGREQFTFYDNGVGTSSHAVARSIGGATGLGFRRNVRDLYEFAGRHYIDGDDIYGFGFSRGAATIRAFAGMVNCCGLVRKNSPDGHVMDEAEFQRQIDLAMANYKLRVRNFSLGSLWQRIFKPEKPWNLDETVKIEFLGLWDTVAALGFPQVWGLDAFVNFFRRHRFYDLEGSRSVNNVFQAIAVDDERRTFWPLVWNENDFMDEKLGKKNPFIEQVWFAGVHSNVGGGYPRPGLANITLDWMIARLDGHRKSISIEDDDRGLFLEKSFKDEVAGGVNPYGKMYDSRAGFALLYRFQPRWIEKICRGRLKDGGPVRLHTSVLDRMERRTADYAPGHLPDRFVEVETRVDGKPSLASPERNDGVPIELTIEPENSNQPGQANGGHENG